MFTEELVARDCLARERAMFIFHTTLLNAEKMSRCAISLEAALCTPTVYFHLCYEEQMTRRRISDVQTLSSATFFAVFLRRFKKKKKRDRLDEPPSPLLLLLQDEWESRGRLALDEAEVRFSMARRMRSNALPFQQKRERDPNTTTKSQRHARQRDDDDEDDDEDDDDEDDD